MGNDQAVPQPFDAYTRVGGGIKFKSVTFEKCWDDAKAVNKETNRYRIKSLSFQVSNNVKSNFYYHDLYLNVCNDNYINLIGYQKFEKSMISDCKFTRYPSGTSHIFHGFWDGEIKANDTIRYQRGDIPTLIESDSKTIIELENEKLSYLKQFYPKNAFLPHRYNSKRMRNDNNNNNDNNDNNNDNEAPIGTADGNINDNDEGVVYEQKEGVPDNNNNNNNIANGVGLEADGHAQGNIMANRINGNRKRNINGNGNRNGEIDLDLDGIEFTIELTAIEWKRFKNSTTQWGKLSVIVPYDEIKIAIENSIPLNEPIVRVLEKKEKKREKKREKKSHGLKKYENSNGNNDVKNNKNKNMNDTIVDTNGKNINVNTTVFKKLFVDCPLCHCKHIPRSLFKQHINNDCPEA